METELAAIIRKHVDALNQVVNDARKAGITVEYDIRTHQLIGRPSFDEVSVKISKEL